MNYLKKLIKFGVDVIYACVLVHPWRTLRTSVDNGFAESHWADKVDDVCDKRWV